MEGGGPEKDPGDVGDITWCKDGKGETGAADKRVNCSEETNVEGKGGRYSGSEGVKLTDHVLPDRPISVRRTQRKKNYAPRPFMLSSQVCRCELVLSEKPLAASDRRRGSGVFHFALVTI